MVRLHVLSIGALIGSVLLLSSCGEDTSTTKVVSEEVVEQEELTKNTSDEHYQIPSPDEMFDFIKSSGVEYQFDVLNSVDHVIHYNSPFKQTLNFGVYAADLAYSSSFGEFQEAIKCFGTVQKLADNIGVASAIEESLVSRIQNNLENKDSIVALTNQLYFSVTNYLESNQQGYKLGVFAAAGWIETLYIVTNSVSFEGNETTYERLADQKLTLDNLLDYLTAFNDDEDVQQVITWLGELQTLFGGLSAENGGKTSLKKSNGKMVLGGGNKLTITTDEFQKIKDKIVEIRTNIVSI